MDGSPLQAATAHVHRLLPPAFEAQRSRMNLKKGSFQRHVMSSTRSESSINKEEDNSSPDSQAGDGTVSGSLISNTTEASSDTDQSSPGSCTVSPIPSLCRARSRALTITRTSGFSHLGQTELQGVQGAHGDRCSDGEERRDFRSCVSPFSRRVKEKLQQVHAHHEESLGGPSKKAVELPALAEDAERNCGLETLGTDS